MRVNVAINTASTFGFRASINFIGGWNTSCAIPRNFHLWRAFPNRALITSAISRHIRAQLVASRVCIDVDCFGYSTRAFHIMYPYSGMIKFAPLNSPKSDSPRLLFNNNARRARRAKNIVISRIAIIEQKCAKTILHRNPLKARFFTGHRFPYISCPL